MDSVSIRCKVRRGDGSRSLTRRVFLGLHEREAFTPDMPFGQNRIRCMRTGWAGVSRVNMGAKISVDRIKIGLGRGVFAARIGNTPTSEFEFLQFRCTRRASNVVGASK